MPEKNDTRKDRRPAETSLMMDIVTPELLILAGYMQTVSTKRSSSDITGGAEIVMDALHAFSCNLD